MKFRMSWLLGAILVAACGGEGPAAGGGVASAERFVGEGEGAGDEPAGGETPGEEPADDETPGDDGEVLPGEDGGDSCAELTAAAQACGDAVRPTCEAVEATLDACLAAAGCPDKDQGDCPEQFPCGDEWTAFNRCGAECSELFADAEFACGGSPACQAGWDAVYACEQAAGCIDTQARPECEHQALLACESDPTGCQEQLIACESLPTEGVDCQSVCWEERAEAEQHCPVDPRTVE